MPRGVKVTASKELSWVQVDVLAEYQAIVGGMIERFPLERGEPCPAGEECSLYLNEEGKLTGLPFNSIATDLALNLLMPGDTIVGDVLIVGPGDGAGGDTDLDKEGPTFRFLSKVADEAGGRWLP